MVIPDVGSRPLAEVVGRRLAGHCGVRACHFEGAVIGVFDGDTVTALDDARVQRKIRMAGIDAPEKGQACDSSSWPEADIRTGELLVRTQMSASGQKLTVGINDH